MTVIQKPDAYSLTSNVKDLIIASETSIIFEVKKGGVSILRETYDPDADDRIYIRDLGKLFECYLSGSMSTGPQAVYGEFTLYVDSTSIGSFTALLCKAFALLPATSFFPGGWPLHLQYGSKVSTPTTKEYLTFYLENGSTVKVKVKYISGNQLLETSTVNIYTSPTIAFQTIEITLQAVSALFPAVDPHNIVSYMVGVTDIYSQFLVDWTSYPDSKTFRYLNVFNCPATLITRGQVTRKRSLNFETTKIAGIEKRYDIKRNDSFIIEFGRKYSRVDEALIAEMTASNLVEVFFQGAFREVLIFEEESEELQTKGMLKSSQFSFRFADERLNQIMYDPFWILEDGTWKDDGVWLDAEPWLDGD